MALVRKITCEETTCEWMHTTKIHTNDFLVLSEYASLYLYANGYIQVTWAHVSGYILVGYIQITYWRLASLIVCFTEIFATIYHALRAYSTAHKISSPPVM